MKKLLLFFLGVLLAFPAFPAIQREFTYEYAGKTLTYTVVNEETKTCATKYGNSNTGEPGNNVSGDLIIPSIVNDGVSNYTVVSIATKSFTKCKSLTSVIIPEGVTWVGYNAFQDCSSLKSVTLPKSVTSISGYAFSGCEVLESIAIPERVTSIGGNVFQSCHSLKSVNIPEGVTSLEQFTFSYCTSLTAITIPENITSMGFGVFEGCSSLESITIPKSVKSTPTSGFKNCSSLTSVIIPEGTTYLGSYAFENCTSLTTINIPESVNSFGYGVFRGCTDLQSIALPRSLGKIDENVFQGCTSLESVAIPETVTEIGESAFRDCNSLDSIIIPEKVTKIGNYAFSGCSDLTNINIPEGVTSIGHSVFSSCSSLKSINIPKSVSSIGMDAFFNCSSLDSVEISEGIKTINSNAFKNCTALKSITLPKSVTLIGYNAFTGCTELSQVTSLAIVPPSVYDTFDYENIDLTVLNRTAYNNYKATAWNNCRNIYTLIAPTESQSIEWNQEFSNITVGDEIELNATSSSGLAVEYSTSDPEIAKINGNIIEFIGEGEVTITASQSGNDDYKAAEPISKNITVKSPVPDQVEILYDFEDNGVYYKIVSESEVEITPISRTTYADGIITYQPIDIGGLCLENEVYYNNTYYKVVGIAAYAFANSEIRDISLNGLTFLSSGFYIGESAFENCYYLTTIYLDNNLGRVGARAFYNCFNLETVTIGADSIMEYAFANCSNLHAVAIGPGSIIQNAFANTPKLKYIFITYPSPDEYSFDNSFGDDTSNLTFLIPSEEFKYSEQFSSFKLEPYGYFDRFEVTYTGHTPEETPKFVSNIPGFLEVGDFDAWFGMDQINAGTYSTIATVHLFGNVGSTYPIPIGFRAWLPFIYTITPAPLIISTGNYERAYGEPNPEISINIKGYLNGDNESVFEYGGPTIVNGIEDIPDLPNEKSDVGIYNIYVWGSLPYDSNYEIEGLRNTPRGSMTIIPANQTLAWEIEDEEFNVGDVVPLEAVSTSGLSVEFISSDPDIAKIEENNLYFLKEGEVTITASQSGNKNYNAAESISRSFVVNPHPKDDSLTLNVSESNLKPEETLQLVIDDYEWTSSDESVATVSETGLVTAVAGGNAVITLSRKSDGATLATCIIKVDFMTSTSEISVKEGVKITCLDHEIKIEGASPSAKAFIYDMNGHTIYSGLDRIIPLESGIYIVSIEGSQLKVNIR